MGPARRIWFAVGETRGEALRGDAGRAMRALVRVVERGMEALRRERRAVWRRWGSMVNV